MNRVFVYGTLKKGHGNNRLLADSTLLGNGVLSDHKLYDSGFPVSAVSDGDEVLGEVWECDDYALRRLDALEGYREGDPSPMYFRRVANIEGHGECYYYLGGPMWDFPNMQEVENENGIYDWS